MPTRPTRKLTRIALATTIITGFIFSPIVVSHYDDKAPVQSYRQSWFAMLAMNFGPMAAMAKGEMPWEESQIQSFAEQLATLTSLDMGLGFVPGSHTGKTRAKPEIWENTEDFKSKLTDLREAAAELGTAAKGGDKKAIGKAIAKTGGACKACHDEYKSEDYLNQ